MNYIALNIKSNYSLLTSLIDIKSLVKYAKENNINTLGLCDDNLCGALEFYFECKNNNIKPIIGLEITYNESKILLYAKNYNGYSNLCYISSNEITLDLLKENHSDLILILPYESMSLHEELSSIFTDIYISYKNKKEREEIKSKKAIFLNEVRAITKYETEFIKYAYMIKNNEKISEENKYDFSNNYLTYEDILNIDLINYKVINESINIDIKKDDNLHPSFSSEESFNEKEYLKKLCEKGLIKRLNNKVSKKYIDRLYYELSIIDKMGFNNYFLVVYDYVKFAKKNNILVGPGRGSAASSLCCYTLGITDIDPIKYDLLFERFLNPERVSMPDIDIDFDSNKIDKVIDYVKEKYGDEKVSRIITFNTMKSKQVLRDLFRLFDIENEDFIKLFSSNISINDNLKDERIKQIVNKDTLLSRITLIASHLENLKRHTSINAAGVIISSKNLNRYIPVYDQSGVKVAGYSVNYLEKLGFLKMDFLALDNLVILDKLKNDIKINLNDIPLNDEKTFAVFNKALTDGIFQFETIGMKNILKKFKVTSFEDLVALIALFRPGPIDNIDSYINRKEGKEKISYLDERLKPILESTYGIIIYQEQIMQIAKTVSNFTLGEADILRRAMSKKDKSIMDNLKIKFIDGAINNNYSKEVANEIFNLIYKFANYGFNKAHSVSYALISYRLAYFKANYLSHFIVPLLDSEISNEKKIKEYIFELKNNNINVLKPSINESIKTFKLINENTILYSLSSIKNLSNVTISKILEEREKGLFTDFFDFVLRCNSFVSKKEITILINASCFDEFNFNHNTLLENVFNAYNYAFIASSITEKPEMIIYKEKNEEELINDEFNSFGFYLSYHPVQLKRDNKITTCNIKENFNKLIELYLLIDKKREITTKKGDKMCFYEASDEFNKIELVVFPKVYLNNYTINKGDIVKVLGNVEKRNSDYQIVVKTIVKCK